MLIGITGTLGAGKGTVVKYLESKGFVHIAVSDTFLAGEAKKRGIEPDRNARHDIANEYRSKGPTKLMEAVYELAKEDLDTGSNVVLEPQHTPEEVSFIMAKGGFVFAVDADINTRYKRIRARGGSKDDVTLEEFKSIEDLEMRPSERANNNLAGAIELCDHIIMNDGTREELNSKIESILKEIK